MRKSLFVILAGALATGAAAQSVRDTHVDAAGAISGRSPHVMLRPVDQAKHHRERVAIHVPAGKPHTYGRHELAPRAAAAAEVQQTAAAEANATTAAE